MMPQFFRLKADILCLEEVNGLEEEGKFRHLLALKLLIKSTSMS